jgi:hypothetical protein
VAGSPITVMYGLAAVSKKVNPLAKTNNAKRKKVTLSFCAATS